MFHQIRTSAASAPCSPKACGQTWIPESSVFSAHTETTGRRLQVHSLWKAPAECGRRAEATSTPSRENVKKRLVASSVVALQPHGAGFSAQDSRSAVPVWTEDRERSAFSGSAAAAVRRPCVDIFHLISLDRTGKCLLQLFRGKVDLVSHENT